MTRQLRVSDDIADWLSSLDAGSLSGSAMRVLVWAREAIEAAEMDQSEAVGAVGPRAGERPARRAAVRTSASASRRVSFAPIIRR